MLNPPDVRARPAPPDKMAAYSALIRRTFSSGSPIHDGAIMAALALRGHTDLVCALAITPDGRTLVSGSYDRTIRRWNLATGAEIGKPLTGHTDWIRALAITPDGRTLVSGSDDRTIRQWNTATGAEIGKPLTGHTNWVCALAITPDGTRCIASCAPSEATGLSVPLRTTGPANAPLSFALTVYTFGT